MKDDKYYRCLEAIRKNKRPWKSGFIYPRLGRCIIRRGAFSVIEYLTQHFKKNEGKVIRYEMKGKHFDPITKWEEQQAWMFSQYPLLRAGLLEEVEL